MATTMSLIAKQTVGSAGAASVTFSSIPQTYTDLKIVISARGTTAATEQSIKILPNGSSSNATFLQLQGYGTGVYTGTGSYWYAGEMSAASGTSNTFGSTDIYIPNYTSSNYKSASTDTAQENNSSGSARLNLNATLWSVTSAITSITIQPAADNFAEFSEFYLYGISSSSTQNTSVPYAYGGDVITTDGTYWYHTFLYSGTFTPLKNLSCDYLVVAGGGGGGTGSNGGGGGAGGLRSTVTATGGGGSLESKLSLTANTVYTATVGAGGASNVNGGDSTLATVTSVGGGKGAQSYDLQAGNGGSGGGSSYASIKNGTGTTNQGYAGGTAAGATSGPAYGGAGGGGAGAVGVDGTSAKAGNGGIGVAVAISGSSVYYAGGGGGASDSTSSGTRGDGGTGGGGMGTYSSTTGTNGTPNTGGGGGADRNSNGLKGGSGIIIVRYVV